MHFMNQLNVRLDEHHVHLWPRYLDLYRANSGPCWTAALSLSVRHVGAIERAKLPDRVAMPVPRDITCTGAQLMARVADWEAAMRETKAFKSGRLTEAGLYVIRNLLFNLHSETR
jgi:hypothetical protein